MTASRKPVPTSPADGSLRGPRHLARVAEEDLERRGDHPALLFEGRVHSAAALAERAARLAGGFAGLGLAPGERVVVCMANCPEVSIVYQAAWRAGLVVTPVTFLLGEAELRHVLADSGARAVVTTPEFLHKVRAAGAGLPELRHVLCTEAAPFGAATEGEALRAAAGGAAAAAGATLSELEQADPAPIVDRDDDDLAALLYTGGTTGRAKGVMLSHASLHYTGHAAYRSAHQPGVTRVLATLPLSHAYGLLVTVAGLHAEEPMFTVLLRWFEPIEFLETVQDHELQQSSVVPTMIQLLLGCPLEDYDLSSLRYLTSGGAPLPEETERALVARLPGTKIRQGYGMTETAALISSSPVGRERIGSVGVPVPGTELEIRDEQGRPLPPGEIGEICVRSPGVMRGYWRAPEATAAAIRDGWLHTGDLGYQDARGYLFVVDRKKDLIIRGGFNVYPRDVEDALTEHPEVAMAGVVGAPSLRHGEEVVAFVALTPGSTLAPRELIAWAKERIGGYKYPREIHIVDAVPLTPVGKIDRKALRARLRPRARR
ncbi:MAG TPA: AMP-binding protein [Solirubrobacteraceae bacterium]|nr:AMP-binding protein [Solirubrobacteraceae bacterium]